MCDIRKSLPRVGRLGSMCPRMLRACFATFSSADFTAYHKRCKPGNAISVKKTIVSHKSDAKKMSHRHAKEEAAVMQYPKRIFSGIQPTGALHLGNYLGAVKQWTVLQETNPHVSFCIVDLHSITLPQTPEVLRDNIVQLAAAMIACGIDQEKSTIFVQSAVKEHAELSWLLGTQTTMARLGHLPQYKEKSRLLKEVPLGLFLYPVLQAADICLYKSTHVPVGEDQVQHIQLAQHLAKTFNTKFGETFPICHAVIEKREAARIRSLRDPSKKMSKSDPDVRSTVNLMDEPEVIVEKFKKALTDFTSDVTYEPEKRPGVSNVVAIHALITERTIESVLDEAARLDTARYKLRVADAVIEHLKPIRTKIMQQLQRRNEVAYFLEEGAKKARAQAAETIAEVKNKMGLGTNYSPFLQDLKFHASAKDVRRDAEVTKVDNILLVPPASASVQYVKNPQVVNTIDSTSPAAGTTSTPVITLGETQEDELKN